MDFEITRHKDEMTVKSLPGRESTALSQYAREKVPSKDRSNFVLKAGTEVAGRLESTTLILDLGVPSSLRGMHLVLSAISYPGPGNAVVRYTLTTNYESNVNRKLFEALWTHSIDDLIACLLLIQETRDTYWASRTYRKNYKVLPVFTKEQLEYFFVLYRE